MQDPLRVWKKALSRYAFAPGKNEVAARRLDDFGIARRVKVTVLGVPNRTGVRSLRVL